MNDVYIIIIQKHFRRYFCMKKFVIKILQNTKWEKLINIYKIYGNSLDTNSMKFIKGYIYEQFICFSNLYFNHIDKNGIDIKYKCIKIECKFEKQMLLTNVERRLKKNISFRFKNSNGSNNIKINLQKIGRAHV